MAMNPDLYHRINLEIENLEQRINRLAINEESFSDWFDSQLFSQDANAPSDYIAELRRQLKSLNSATTAARSQWLSEHLAHQLSALHQAVRWFEQKNER